MKTNIIEILTKINECNKIIGNETFIRDKAKKEIDEILSPFSFSPIKEIVQQALFDNFEKDHQILVEKEMESINKVKEDNSLTITSTMNMDYPSSYSNYVSTIFNPFVDTFNITNFKKVDDKHYMLEVECIKNSKYLGVSGARMPDLYWTVPINVNDLFVDKE